MREEFFEALRVHKVGPLQLETVGSRVRFPSGGEVEKMYRTLSPETEIIEVTSPKVLELPTDSGVSVRHHGILHFRGSLDHRTEFAAPLYVASGMISSGLSTVSAALRAEDGLIALQEVNSNRIDAEKVWIERCHFRGASSTVRASIVAIGRLAGGEAHALINGKDGIYLGIIGGVDTPFQGRLETEGAPVRLGIVFPNAELRVSAVGVMAKPHLPGARYDIANDQIGSEILNFIGLQVPPFAVTRPTPSSPNEIWFASANFNFKSKYGHRPPQVDPERCAKELPDLSTGLILGDVFIKNPERTPWNLFADFDPEPAEMFVYDQNACLHGVDPFLTSEELLKPEVKDDFGIRNHCLLNCLSTDLYFNKWIQRIKSIPSWWLEAKIEKAGRFIDNAKDEELGAIFEFLVYRRDHFVSLVQKNHPLFKGIQDWSLDWAPGLRAQKTKPVIINHGEPAKTQKLKL
jgi:hypothetical protein